MWRFDRVGRMDALHADRTIVNPHVAGPAAVSEGRCAMQQAEPGSFGEQLRSYRERIGLTQEELAERAGLSAQGISALERGLRRRPYLPTMRALAEALGLSAHERAAFASAIERVGPCRPESSAARSESSSSTGLPTPLTPLIG